MKIFKKPVLIAAIFAIILAPINLSASQPGTLARLWDWMGTSEAASKADVLTDDRVSEGLESLANQITNTVGDERAIRGLEAGKSELVGGEKMLKDRYEDLLREKKDLKDGAYRSFKAERASSGSLKAMDAAKKIDSKYNYITRSKVVDKQILEVKTDMANNARSQGVLNARIDKAKAAPSFLGRVKGFVQKGGQLLNLMDIAGATGRVSADIADVFEGTGTLGAVFERIAEEGAKMKAVSLGAATGAGAAILTGPISPIAAPLMSMAGAGKASDLFEEQVSSKLEKIRQARADDRAKTRFSVDEEQLAIRRAENRARSAIAARRRQIEAKGREYQESLKYLDDMRAKIAALYERDRLLEQAKKESVAREISSLPAKKPTGQKVVPQNISGPTITKKQSQPVPTKSGSVSRTFSTGAYEITVTVNGATLLDETLPKKRGGSLNAGELRLAASSSHCSIHISYQIKQAYGASIDETAKAGSTFIKVDFLELNENWANTSRLQQKFASGPVHRGNGPHSGEFSIPVECNDKIKKYMISTDSSFLTSDIYFSVLLVVSQNRHFFKK